MSIAQVSDAIRVPTRRLIDAREAGRMLGCSWRTVLRLADAGKLPWGCKLGALRRWELLRFLPAIITGRLPTDHPQIWTGRCRQVVVQSREPLIVHLDGEFFCVPKDGVRRIDVKVLPGALNVVAA